MSKRRITLNLDEDVVAALRAVAGSSMSAVANEALREALERKAHQLAVLEWLEELYAEHGRPSDADYAEADEFLEALERGEIGSVGGETGPAHGEAGAA